MKTVLRAIRKYEPAEIYDFFQSMPEDELGFQNSAYGISREDFPSYLSKQVDTSEGLNLSNGRVPQTYFLLFIDDEVVGVAKLRHKLTPRLLEHSGNIGIGITEKFRGRGYSKILLQEVLKEAKKLGLEKVLLTCNEDNIPSYRAIEFNKGVLEKIENDTRYYWINL